MHLSARWNMLLLMKTVEDLSCASFHIIHNTQPVSRGDLIWVYERSWLVYLDNMCLNMRPFPFDAILCPAHKENICVHNVSQWNYEFQKVVCLCVMVFEIYQPMSVMVVVIQGCWLWWVDNKGWPLVALPDDRTSWDSNRRQSRPPTLPKYAHVIWPNKGCLLIFIIN